MMHRYGLNLARTKLSNTIFFLLISSFCLFLPFIIFTYYDGSYLAYANESLAYRYFTTYRLMSGEQGLLWLPQGFFTLALQKIILLVQNHFIVPYASFRSSLEWFGIFTNTIQSLLALIVLAIIFTDSHLKLFFKWLPLIFFILMLYGTNNNGMYYNILPDYYQLDVALMAACLGSYFYIAFRNSSEISHAAVGCIGILTGLAIVNKLSLLFPFLAPISLLTIKQIAKPKKLGTVLLVYTSTVIIGIILPLLFLYLKNHKGIALDFAGWVKFVRSPGSENSFLGNLRTIYTSGSNYVVFTLTYICVWFCVFITVIRKHSMHSLPFLNCIILLSITLLSFIIPLKARAAGTTNFETFGSISALTMMSFSLIPTSSIIYQRKYLIVIFWLLLLHPIMNLKQLGYDALGSKKRADIAWSAHNALLASGGNAIMILPNNSYGIGSVEELLLKGLSEFPTWYITTGKETLKQFANNLSFYTDYNKEDLRLSSFNYTNIMWIDKKEDVSLTVKIQALNSSLLQGYHCKQLPFDDQGLRIINICSKNAIL